MSQKGSEPNTTQGPSVEPISAPSGLNLNPKPPEPRRVSKRAAGAIAAVAFLLLLAFAYGGLKRSKTAQVKADRAGIPKALAPATSAGNEFTKAIPPGNAAVKPGQPSGQLKPPGEANAKAADGVAACGADPKTGEHYRFNPQTGTPCDKGDLGCGSDLRTGQPYRYDPLSGRPCGNQNASIERVAIRRAPPSIVPQPAQEASPEERRVQESYRREQEAMQAPTGVHLTARAELSGTSSASVNPTRQSDLAQVAALGAALSGGRNAEQTGLSSNLLSSVTTPQTGSADYDSQNMQTKKEQFLDSASAKKTDDYLKSIRSAPLSEYEIKAGWEIPAVLEQALNSDLPGEIKALVLSNVYDTASGQYLLIPQGSRLIGRYDSRVAYGQDGVQVVWNRIIFPDASSIDLAGMVGLDSQGNSGLRNKVDRHYKRLFGFAALTSAFNAAFEISQRRSQSVLATPSVSETASSSVGRELSETGAQITRRNLNVQPTIKVPAGYKFTVRVNRDILFDAPYAPESADPETPKPDQGLKRRSGL